MPNFCLDVSDWMALQTKLVLRMGPNYKHCEKFLCSYCKKSDVILFFFTDTRHYQVVLLIQTNDEDLWLEALEKGELDDNGEIPKVRDPSLMTARQRALLNRTSSSLVEEILPESKEETEEDRKKRLEKNRLRKIQVSRS